MNMEKQSDLINGLDADAKKSRMIIGAIGCNGQVDTVDLDNDKVVWLNLWRSRKKCRRIGAVR